MAWKGGNPHRATKEYRCWERMKRRCRNKNDDYFHLYGGRGIRVHPSWSAAGTGFAQFLADVGPIPEPKSAYSLDRIDPNGHYEPGNVRWATWTEQQNNRRNNRVINAFGKSQTIAEWSREMGISQTVIRNRIRTGWDPARAVGEPLTQSSRPGAARDHNGKFARAALSAEVK